MSNSTKTKKMMALSLALTALISSLTGCGVESESTITGMEKFATVNEVRDYYAEELSYDTIITRRVTENVTQYVKEEVDEEHSKLLKDYVSKIEAVLSKDKYEVADNDTETLNLISENEFNYIKAQIDGMALSNGTVGEIKQAKGFYFVDVTYNVSAQAAGTFKECADMAGLNGVWTTDKLGKHVMSKSYIQFALRKLNDYFYDKKMAYEATYDEGSMTFKIIESTANLGGNKTIEFANGGQATIEAGEFADKDNPAVDTPNTDGNSTGNKNSNNPASQQVDTSQLTGAPSILEKEISDKSVIDPSRRVKLDINFINNVVGSVGDSANLPELELVYNIPSASGISGYGIYQEGTTGFFGFNRNKLAGTLTLRYVFKDSVDGSGNIVGTNIYIENQEITTGFSTTDKKVNVSNSLKTELGKVVERNDRMQVNGDISGLMCGGVYEDKGAAILRAFKVNCTNILRYTSTIRNIIARDTERNAYLLEVETATIDGAINCNSYGLYKDTYYVVVQQQGENFVIADSVKMKREVISEPDISPDSATIKRLVAFNLSDEVSDGTKGQISDLLSTFYTAGSNRIAEVSKDEPKEIVSGDNKITLTRGIEDCFNTNTEMLSEERRDYLIQQIESMLIANGTNIDAAYQGKVSEWIGGYKDQQAEFMTEELISYSGMNQGHYMEVYYLVSNQDGQWVIDERNIVDEYDVEGADLEAKASRMN
jgi:hypothetical protein